MRVVFAAGGTGGHLYPAIAIADALRRRDATIVFIGSADRLETTIVPRAGYALRTVAAHPLPRRPSFAFFRAIARNVQGTMQSFKLLGKERPDIVIATGGYVCFPVAFAARIRRFLRLSRAPIALLEPNASPGITTRLLTPIVDEVWRDVPVRSSLRQLPARAEAAARLGLEPQRKTLLAMGGSQGAQSITNAVVDAWKHRALPEDWQVLALTGTGSYPAFADAIRGEHSSVPFFMRAYLDDMADAYAVADLVLSRAGASTLGELAALAKPAILVPYPHATEGHQESNAARFTSAGAAIVVRDTSRASGSLREAIAEATEPARLAQLEAGARQLQTSDPLERILTRVEALTRGKQ